MQGYNKGAYYRWYPDDDAIPLGPGKWKEEPPNGYGRDAKMKFDNVKNGGPLPDGWNTTYDN
jgi:hypothetical protein